MKSTHTNGQEEDRHVSKHTLGEYKEDAEPGCTPLPREVTDKVNALTEDLHMNHGIKAVYVYLRGAETTGIHELGRVRELCELFLQGTATTFADLMSNEGVPIQARKMIALALLEMVGRSMGMPSLMHMDEPSKGDVLDLFDHKRAPVQ